MTSRPRIQGLIDEYPLLVYPSLAKALGLNTSIIIQQIHFLIENARSSRNQYVNIDGDWWVYNSLEEWAEVFTWLSVTTIQRTMAALEADGLIKSRQGVKDRFDRRKWYTVNYAKLAEVVPSIMSKWHDENTSKWHDDNKESDTTSESVAPKGAKATPSKVAPRIQKAKTKDSNRDAFYSKADALIEAWASAMGFDGAAIGASYNSTTRRKIANAMLKWDVPPTPEEITRFVSAKVKVKPDYEFNWLEDDLPKWRKQGEKSTPPGFVSATAGLIFEN